MIKENFLHFVWKLQYFNKEALCTTAGENVMVLHPGTPHTDAGPDFQNARIRIGNIEWCGNVEIHSKSSDWSQHRHNTDKAYGNVILHVVYADDKPVCNEDGTSVPCIELKHRIDEQAILKYLSLQSSHTDIPCSPQLASVPNITKVGMIERMVTERMMQRQQSVLQLLKRNRGDWQETNYQLIASNFGFKLNAEPFLRLAKILPLKILLKHRDHPEQLEALLFGHAGFLKDKINDPYYQKLKREYEFLSKKFSLEGEEVGKHEWKFLRIRPANFPTIRIAQFASLIHYLPEIFTSFTEIESPKAFYQKLSEIFPSEYWNSRYTFDSKEAEEVSVKKLGKESLDNILINTIVPVYFSMGKEKGLDEYIDKGFSLLASVAPEVNSITKKWMALGMPSENALDTQGTIHLFNHYCKRKACLECEIGTSIIRSDKKSLFAEKT